MSKSLQKCILFAVCIALVCALGVTLFIFDGTGGAVTGQEGQASNVAKNTTTYTHGSDIGRQYTTQGTVHKITASGTNGGATFKSAITANNGDIVLEADIDLGAVSGTDDVFEYNIYGNGHTITFTGALNNNGTDGTQKADRTYWGGVIGTLSGKVYDLNVIMSSGQITILNSDSGPIALGGMIGRLNGGRIENCTMTLRDRGTRIGAVKNRSSSGEYAVAAAMVAMVEYGSTIKNCTVSNNAWIESGLGTWNGSRLDIVDFTNSSGGWGSADGRNQGRSGNLAGQIGHFDTSGTVTIDNIIITNTETGDSAAQVKGIYVGNIGIVLKGTTLNVTNFYNDFSGTYTCANNGGSASISHDNTTHGTATITNYYVGSGAVSSLSNSSQNEAATTKTNTINVPENTNVYFDPSASDISNSLAIVHSTSNAPAGSNMKRTYTITGQNGYSSTSTEISTATAGTDTVIFRNLSTNASNWNSGGNLSYTVSYTDTPIFNDYLPKPTVYEHGYVPADYTAAAGSTQITSAEQFMSLFRPNGGASKSTPYVLTSDIVISGFSGIDFSGGTLDGAGHTIYIIDKLQDTYTGPAVGGLVGQLGGGTIKNLRIVYVNSIDITVTNSVGRVGLVAGSVNGGTIQNVEVIVQEGVTIGATNTNDHDLAMGGVLGTASGNASIKDVTVELNGTLNPTGKWQSLGGMVGLINSVNGATFTDVAIRGTGTFAGNALNEGQPTFTAAIAVVRSAAQNGSAPQGTYATVDGLIYDLDVKFAGTVQTEGNSNGQYSCYYLFTYNYNNNGDYGDDGWQPNSPISEYNTAVSYSNVFVNSAYKDKLAEYAGQRTNGNAAIGGAVINTIQNKVEGLENPVAAYFNPVDGADDMIFRASGSWDSDRMVILTLSDGTVRESKLETAGVNTSAKLVYAPKTLAATDNVVQLSLYENVNWPTAPAALTYNGAEQSFAFTLHTVSGTPVESGDYTVTYSVKEGNTGGLGGNNLPLNAGTYTATIELTNGMEFIDDGQGTTSPEYSLTVTVAPFKVEGNWTYNGGLTITYGDPVPSDIDQYISVSLTTSNIPGGLSAVTASGFTTDYTQGTAAGKTVNIKAVTYAVDSGSAGNYDFTGITGSGSVEVQKREITISAADIEDPAVGHIVAIYGGTNYVTSQADLQNLLTWANVSDYVENVYGTDEIGFTITAVAHEQTGDGATYAPGEAVQEGEWAKLPAKDTYYITVTSANNNYTVAENNYFKYQVSPAELVVTGVVWDDTALDTITYDGQKHTAKLKVTGLVGEDTYDSALIVSLTLNSEAVENGVNAGTYTVDVEVNEDDKYYDLGVSGDSADLTLAISPITLTPSPVNGTFTAYTSSNLPGGTDFVTSGILESDSEVTVAVTWGSNAPADSVVGSGSYVAVNTYTANLAIQGDTNNNYTLSADTATFTIKPYDLANATITVNTEGITAYTGSEQTVGVTVMAGTADITDLVTIDGDAETNAGEGYTVSISSKDSNTTGSQTAETTWSIAKADYNMEGVTFENDSITYDGESHTLTISEDSLPTGADGIKVTVTYSATSGDVNITNVGSVAITATFATTSTNYNTPAAKTATLTIEKANYDMTGVTFENDSITYDGESHTLTVSGELPTGADGIKVTVEYTAVNGGEVNITNVGSVDIKATFATESANYNVPEAKTATLTVTPKDVTFAWSVSGEIVEGMAVEDVKALANPTNNGGILEADTYTFGVDIGDYTADTPRGTQVTFTPSVKFTEAGDAANYNITFSPETAQLTVQLRKVEIGVTEATVTVDYVNGYTTEEQFLANFTTTTEGLTIDSTLFEITVTDGAQGNVTLNGAPLNAGTYTVTISPTNSGVTIADDSVTTYTYQVTATVAVISWEADTDLIYNGAEHTLTATVANKVESDEVNVIVSLTEDADNVKVTAEGFTFTATGLDGAAKGNYTLDGAINLTSDVKTITPATLNITQTAEATLTRPYDGTTTEATSFLTKTYVTITGGVSGENIYGMLNAELTSGVEIKNAGRYVITVTFNAEAEGAGNYSVGDFTSLEIGYTVTAKTITITFGGYEDLTYNGQAHTLTATADFVSGASIDLDSLIAYTGDVTDGSAINAGDYTATITKAQIVEQNANYTLAAESATQEFAISPATLTLTQADGAQLSRVYDGTATEVGAFVSADYFTVSGYVDGGNEYALFTAAVAEGLTIQNADSYTINITLNSGAEGAGNYTCETFAINYEVTPIQWTASVADPEGGLTYDGEDKLGSLVITDDNEEGAGLVGAPEIVATVTGGSMVNAGTYTVTLQLQTDGAVYSGGNYELTAESAEIEIAKRVVEISWAKASEFTYTGAAHTLTATVNNRVGEDVVNATVELSGDNVKVTESGFTYTVTGLEGTAAENYTIEGAENLTSETQYIARATLTVQFEGISGLVYTGTAHPVTATATGWQNSENYDSTLNGLITIGGDDTQALNAGDYTATITKAELETALDNYTLAQDASVEFTVAPATLNVSVAIAGDGVADNKLTWHVDGAVTVSDTADGWTLTSGETSYTVTVTGADGVASNVLQLTLNGSEYTGTPYGTRVEDGKLAVASTNPNYTVELVTTVSINIVPDISIEIRTGEGYENTAVYNVNTTYTTADFEDYFYIDREPEGGTWDYSVEGVESGSFSNVGTYTVKATFTIASGIPLENHFTFTITQATVTGVVLNGEGAYTYGGLKAGDTVSVTVTYSDGNTATVNATFKADTSTGGYVKAGESVKLTLTDDDGKNTNYAKVNGQTVTVSVSKAEITADISYMDNSAAEGVLTLPYIGSEGYSNITVSLNGVLGDDVIYGMLKTAIINAGTYDSLEIALNGDDSGSYVITNAADLSVRVTPKEITVEWSNVGGFTYDGTAKVPTATANGTFDSDEVTLTVTVTGETTEGQAINAGDYTATVAAFESGNYKLSAASEKPFSIAKATATLGIENYQDSVVYNAGAVTVTPTVNGAVASEGIVNVTIAYTADGSEAVTVGEIRNAGSYTVTLQISGALNYADASQEFVITVTRAQLTVNTANTSFTYGDNIDLGATVTAIGGDDVSVAIDRVVSGEEPAELKNAGSYTVTYRLEGAAAGNYTIAAGGSSVDVTIEAKKLTFTWNSDQTFTYNGAAQVPEYTLDGVVDGDEVTVTVTVTDDNATECQAINAGGYTASVAEITEGNYSLTGVQQFPFTIGKANLTLTPDSVKFSDRDADKLSAYSKTNYEATIKTNVTVTGVGSDGVFNDFTVTTGASFTGENGTLTVGNYIFTVRVASGNYNDATYTVTVIEQPVAEFTATPSSRTYTGGEITFTFANEEGIQLEEGVQITVSGITFNNASAASVLDAGRYTVTFAVTGNIADNNYWYTVSSWSGNISPATVEANAVTAVYGDVYALETGGNLQHGTVWQFVTFKNSPVEVTVTVTDATARAGETYLGAGTYDVTVTLVSGNFTFAGGNSVASTLQITPKQLNIAAQLPEDLTYTSEGIVIGLEDYASQLVGDDNVTVSMLVDGKPYVAGVTVLGAGQHTVTVTMTDTSGNYTLAQDASQTFTVEKKEVTSSITVSGETIENNSSLEIVHGENARVQNAIDNYLTQNGVEKGEYTLTVTDSAGQAADLHNISAWAPGTYTVNLGLSDNFEGGMTFTIVVQEGTTAQIPDAPVLPSTPLEDGGSSGVADWLFPLIIAIECLIAVALIVAIAVSAARRGKNS